MFVYDINELMTDIDEDKLPDYLQKSIKEFRKRVAEGSIEANDFYCDLTGSINMAQHAYEISEADADYLRQKYLHYMIIEKEK